MGRRVIVSPEARGDLLRLNGFLSRKSARAARRAIDVIDTGLRELGDYPERGRPVGDGIRSLPIRFGASGCVVQYRIDEDAVLIARIFHMREDRAGG